MTRRGTPLFRSQQQARTCAVCVDRPADRMDTLEPGGVEFPMCSVCATQAVRDPEAARHTVSHKTLDPRGQRIREHRDRLKAAGICVNGENHGKAIHGNRCGYCYERDRLRDAQRRGR